jgi:hypothetical protein
MPDAQKSNWPKYTFSVRQIIFSTFFWQKKRKFTRENKKVKIKFDYAKISPILCDKTEATHSKKLLVVAAEKKSTGSSGKQETQTRKETSAFSVFSQADPPWPLDRQC